MILVLSDGGAAAVEMYGFLESIDAPNIFHFSDFESAGTFGRGNTIVGKASYRAFRRILYKNRIDCVIDIIEAPMSDVSKAMLAAAADAEVPVIKTALPTMRLSPDEVCAFAEKAGISITADNSYKSVAETINNTVGNVLFLAKPYNVKAVADLVFDRSALYAPVLGGAEFDVEYALEYGIPILNVIAANGFSGAEGIEGLIWRVGAKILVTDSSLEIADKLKAAANAGCNVIFTQDSGFDYKYMAGSFDELKEILDLLGGVKEPYVSDENSENLEENTKEMKDNADSD